MRALASGRNVVLCHLAPRDPPNSDAILSVVTRPVAQVEIRRLRRPDDSAPILREPEMRWMASCMDVQVSVPYLLWMPRVGNWP